MVRLAKQALEDKKGLDIVILDVRKVSSVTDYYVLATGTSPPHLKAMADELHRVLKKAGQKAFRKAGTPESEWLAADYVDLVVHILSPQAREYYGLETLWNDAPRVAV